MATGVQREQRVKSWMEGFKNHLNVAFHFIQGPFTKFDEIHTKSKKLYSNGSFISNQILMINWLVGYYLLLSVQTSIWFSAHFCCPGRYKCLYS